MATADFTFGITLDGTLEEVLAMLTVFQEYEKGKNGVYFSFCELKRGCKTVRMDKLDEDALRAFVEDGEGAVEVSGLGPYGRYGELNDIDVFREMAEAAPNASLEVEITGFTSYTEQSLRCDW